MKNGNGCCNGQGNLATGELGSPERNRYYYGKLLDAFHFELEQTYANEKRWLLNRLSLGAGVLCGLRVEASADRSRIRIAPGVAVDGLGREIVVPRPSAPIDPRQPTDDCGHVTDSPLLKGGVVTVYLCYHECPRDPAPVLVESCGPEDHCEYGIIEERYRVRIDAGSAPPAPDLVGEAVCRRVFGQKPQRTLEVLEKGRGELEDDKPAKWLALMNVLRERREESHVEDPGDTQKRWDLYAEERRQALRASRRRSALCELLGGYCPTPEDPCVPLARVKIDSRGRVVDIENCGVRRPLFSNAVLLDLILCLAERVDACCAEPKVKSLSIVSGDNQVGVTGEILAEPLVVRVDEAGQSIKNEPVVFEVLADGEIGSGATLGQTFSTQTAADGTATLPKWRLGAGPGSQMVVARIAQGSPNLVTFSATAREVKQELPVIRAIWPRNATFLAFEGQGADAEAFRIFAKRPSIQITFDRPMSEAQLNAPNPWLSFFVLRPRSTGTTVSYSLVRLALSRILPPMPSFLGEAGSTETYAIERGSTPESEESREVLNFLLQPHFFIEHVRSTLGADEIEGMEVVTFGGGSEGGGGGSHSAFLDAIGGMVAPSSTTEVPMVNVGEAQLPAAVKCLILAHSVGGNITAAAPPGAGLDAEFIGTGLPAAILEQIAQIPVGGSQIVGQDFWNKLIPVTGAVLPESGDGQEGGIFHSWFRVALSL